jgi:selenocysteine lyase/cysteine desulfurase
VLYLVDACQSAGQMPLDVERIGCDFLSSTGRKFLRGPRGIGFLYVRRSVLERLEPPFVDLHSATWTAADRFEWRGDARRFENWETNFAAKIGLAVAVDYALAWGLPAIRERTFGLAALLRDRLRTVPGAVVHDLGREPSGIVTFTLDGHEPLALKLALRERRINVTVTDVEAARLDLEARGLEALVRASPHYYNSEAEVDRFVAELGRL